MEYNGVWMLRGREGLNGGLIGRDLDSPGCVDIEGTYGEVHDKGRRKSGADWALVLDRLAVSKGNLHIAEESRPWIFSLSSNLPDSRPEACNEACPLKQLW